MLQREGILLRIRKMLRFLPGNYKLLLPTGSVKVECSPPERKVVSSSHSRVIPKNLKMVVNILSCAPSLRTISINQKDGCLVSGCCVHDSRVQMGS